MRLRDRGREVADSASARPRTCSPPLRPAGRPRRCPAPRPTRRAGCSSSGWRTGRGRSHLLAAELVRDPAGVGDRPTAVTSAAPSARPRRTRATVHREPGAERPPRERDGDAPTRPRRRAGGGRTRRRRHAVGVRPAVLDERRPRERPAGDGGRGHDRGEREQRRLDPVATQPEPEHEPEDGRRDTGPRGGEQHGYDGRVRERRPASGQGASRAEAASESASTSSACRPRARARSSSRSGRAAARPGRRREERRDRLPGERPDDAAPNATGESRAASRAAPGSAEQEPDREKGGVDERPVELRPREVGRDRPGDREPAPGQSRAGAPRARARRREAAAPGQRERASSRRRRAGRERGPDRVAGEQRRPSSNAAATDIATSGLRIAAKLAW